MFFNRALHSEISRLNTTLTQERNAHQHERDQMVDVLAEKESLIRKLQARCDAMSQIMDRTSERVVSALEGLQREVCKGG